jgi:hypothetical protein
MTPFYQHLQGVPGFGMASDIDRIGLWATVGVGAAFAAHGIVELARHWWPAQTEPTSKAVPNERDES